MPMAPIVAISGVNPKAVMATSAAAHHTARPKLRNPAATTASTATMATTRRPGDVPAVHPAAMQSATTATAPPEERPGRAAGFVMDRGWRSR
jgi:hypothetical protein